MLAVLVERKWYEPWLSFPVHCCREMYRISSCRGDPARRTGTARWTQKPTGTAIRQRRWVQNGVRACRWSKACPHWPAESSARRSRWTGRREASARRWRGSHHRDPPSITRQHVKSEAASFWAAFQFSDLQQKTCVQNWATPSPPEPANTHTHTLLFYCLQEKLHSLADVVVVLWPGILWECDSSYPALAWPDRWVEPFGPSRHCSEPPPMFSQTPVCRRSLLLLTITAACGTRRTRVRTAHADATSPSVKTCSRVSLGRMVC